MDGHQAHLILEKVREQRPVVHAIMNMVAAHSAANAALMVGGRPVMADSLREVVDIVQQADSLVLNIGMLNTNKLEAMIAAGCEANSRGIPVVLDPVGIASSAFRKESTLTLLNQVQVDLIRGNASELAWLAGLSESMRGVDVADDAPDMLEIAIRCAENQQTIAAVTGQIDVVSDGKKSWGIRNGHYLMSQVTGFGCMASVVVASFMAVSANRVEAAVAALAAFGVAGELAAQKCEGPGSFLISFWDCLYALNEETFKGKVDIKEYCRMEGET